MKRFAISVAAGLFGVLPAIALRAESPVATLPTTVPTTKPVSMVPPAGPIWEPAPKYDVEGNIQKSFQQHHASFMKRKTEGEIGLLLLGDSITEGWLGGGKKVYDEAFGEMHPANFGIGGDRTEHVLWRIKEGELDGISPKVVMLMIGTNNIGNKAEDIIKADEKIVSEIHEKLPDTQLLLLGIFPRGTDPKEKGIAAMRDKIKTVNEALAKLEDGKKTRYLDIGDVFLEDGVLPKTIMPDALHPNAKGYVLWANAVLPELREMMGLSKLEKPIAMPKPAGTQPMKK